jgi:hypothetical protein
MQTLRRLIAVSLLTTLLAFEAGAEERNGLLVNVSKRTLNRADRRDTVYYTQYDRTQGYKVTIKNTSLKALPEGEVNWTILVLKPVSGTTEKYVGTEKLKPLRSSETVELMIGAVPIGGYRYERDYKDEMEHEIVISHAGKETLRSSSKPSFAALAKRATLIETESETTDTASDPAAAAMKRKAVPATPGTPATPGAPATPAGPGIPATPATAGNSPAPTAPGTPAAPGTTPPAAAAQPSAPIPPPESSQPFDFFNLKKKPAAPEVK